ncbi:MAG: NADH-quinone oxidoreductase subunit J, partial [Deltaproteobacteria bacterium]|nr:NADH-quinone oxidoreductase subunit J [Deltaproteobacteria bacterium]
MELFVFFTLSALLIASSLLVIFQRNPVHSALSLVAALFIVAIIFLMLEAPMLAALQILVYAGAIMVIFLFVIMLLGPGAPERRQFMWWSIGSLGAALLALGFSAFLLPSKESKAGGMAGQVAEGFGSPRMLADSLFTDFVLPFEIASILLLVAIIGTV